MARYENWHHLRVEGDPAAARALIPLARKVLGATVEQAAFNKLQTHKFVHKIDNGGEIVGELIGGIPRVTIKTGPGGKGREIRTLEGFYFARKTAENAEGTSAMMVEPREDIEGDDWTALFYSSSSDGYDDVSEDRRGVYVDVFGSAAKKPWKRMETGNGMWVDRDTKEAVTWYRGYPGYWPLHFRHPITNYALFVSIYGHLVYTAPFVEWRVLAAAKRGMYLYVMIAEDLGALNPPARPATAEESGTVWFSQPYTDEAYTYSLWRYPLTIETQPDTLIDTYKAVRHEYAEMLWQGTLELAYGAWTFNADCTSVVTIQLPRRAMLAFHVYKDEDAMLWRTSADMFDDYPVAEAKRIELTIEHVDEGPPNVTKAEEDAPITIAEEDGTKLNLVLAEYEVDPEHVAVVTYSRMEYQCGDFAIAAFDGRLDETFSAQTVRNIIYADIPTKTFLFQYRYLGAGADRQVILCYELYVNGEAVAIGDDPFAVDTIIDSSGVSPVTHQMAESKIQFPWAGVYNLSQNDYRLRLDFDSMTVLLGIIFSRRATGDASGAGGPHSQSYLIPTIPYIPFTCRILTEWSPYIFAGGVDANAGAGGWSVSKHGGPGPFDWDDWNGLAPAIYFNRGQYDDTEPSISPFPCAFGYASSFDGEVVAAVKCDPWGEAVAGSPYPYMSSNQFYPLRYATSGVGRVLIDAIDPRLADSYRIYYSTYAIGHTGKPMRRQQTRFRQ